MSELWLPPPDVFELLPGVAHLWRASLDRPAEGRAPLAALLSPEEQARAVRFHFEHGRHHYEVGRGLLRWLLGQYLHLPPQEVAFDYGEHGKPSLRNDSTLEFNVSHGQGKILYGFCRTMPIGVDIEQIRLRDRADKLARRFFSALENEDYDTVAPEDKAEAFFNCWTRKEAYIKAIGEGLSCPLREFDVTLRPGEPARLRRIRGSEEAAADWTMLSLTPFPGYRGAALVNGCAPHWLCFDGDKLEIGD